MRDSSQCRINQATMLGAEVKTNFSTYFSSEAWLYIYRDHLLSRVSQVSYCAFITMIQLFSALLVFFLSLANALITFDQIDTLAVITTSCFKTISRHESFQAPPRNIQSAISHDGNGQTLELVSLTNSAKCHLEAGSKRPQVIADALSNLNSNLTAMLDVSMEATVKVNRASSLLLGSRSELDLQHIKQSDRCFKIVKQHRALLTSTAWLLNTLDEKQQMNRWARDSLVYKSFSGTQALWASRRMVC